MDFKWLQDFVCLGRTLNFTRAAEQRNVTQPAFSRRIKLLEHWMGVPLVVRSTYPVQLSEAGREFLPVARKAIANLTDIRQALRAKQHGGATFQKIAVVHTISINYLTKRITELEKEIPNLRVRVFSDYSDICCQLFADGVCDFLLYYHHTNVVPNFDEHNFARKDIGVEKFGPVAEASTVAINGWDISRNDIKKIPYLSYDPSSYLGTVVDQVIGSRAPPLVPRYIDAHSEALKRRALAGSGVAWLSDHVIADELASGKLVYVGGPEWQTELTLSIFCSPERLDQTGQLFWNAL